MKQGTKNIWEGLFEETIDDLDSFNIPHNRVLVEMDRFETDRTIGGIIVVKEHDFAAHAIRWGKVKKLPERLYCNLNDPNSMPWECDNDLEIGDEVCIIYQDSYYAYPFNNNGKYHRLVNYEGIVLSKRGVNIIMCNGFVLLEKVTRKLKAGYFEKEVDDPRWGTVKAIGKPNKRYRDFDKKKKKEILRNDSQIKLEPGDRVFIEDTTRVFDLEDWAHAKFEERKIFKVANRRRLGAVVSKN